MTEAHPSGVSTVELIRQTWHLLRGHARLFVLLMGVPILAQLLAVVVMALLILPLHPGESLREAWLAMDEWLKVAIALLFLAILAVIYRALAASVFAAAEIRSGRSVSVWQALRHVRRKQLRLFWRCISPDLPAVDCANRGASLALLSSTETKPKGSAIRPFLEPGCANKHLACNVGNGSILVQQREILQMSTVKDGIQFCHTRDIAILQRTYFAALNALLHGFHTGGQAANDNLRC
jgi:hypothetical protein